MSKQKVLSCPVCDKQTVHTRIERDSVGKGTGIFRPFLAAVSLGASEMTMYSWYQCQCCGNLKKIR